MQFYITAAGVSAAANAAAGGFKINITNFKLGSGSGYAPTGNETALQGTIEYSGAPIQIYQIDASTVMCVLRADDTVGPFAFGEIGIYLDTGTLFAIGVLPTALNKTANTPSVPGNVVEFDAALTLTNVAAVINFPTYTGTVWGSITGVLSNQTDLQTALNAKQNLLGFVPTQQGTGIGQGANVVKIGYASAATGRLKVTVDNTDLGNVVFDSQLAWNNISGKPQYFPALWGSIGGVLASQADLSAALAAKASLSGANFTGPITASNLHGVNSGDQDLSTYLQDAPNNTSIYGRRAGTWYVIPPSATPTWGSISGTLSNQADLQAALNALAPLYSPTFVGTPAAPTAAAGTNSTQIASTAFVQQLVAGLFAAGTSSLRIGNILIQWGAGVATLGGSPYHTASLQVTFPISYGSFAPAILVTPSVAQVSSGSYTPASAARSPTATGFLAYFDNDEGSSPPINVPITFTWLAIGNTTAALPVQSAATAGGAAGGGGGCVVITSTIDGRPLLDYVVGDPVPVLSDGGVFSMGHVTRVGAVQMQPCLMIVTAAGARVPVSTTTPVVLQDGTTVMSDQLAVGMVVGVRLHGIDGWSPITSIDSIGEQPVLLLTTEGLSYPAAAAGSDPELQVYTHNVTQKV